MKTRHDPWCERGLFDRPNRETQPSPGEPIGEADGSYLLTVLTCLTDATYVVAGTGAGKVIRVLEVYLRARTENRTSAAITTTTWLISLVDGAVVSPQPASHPHERGP